MGPKVYNLFILSKDNKRYIYFIRIIFFHTYQLMMAADRMTPKRFEFYYYLQYNF